MTVVHLRIHAASVHAFEDACTEVRKAVMQSETPSFRVQTHGRDRPAELVVHLASIELRIRHVRIEL
jgi:hypothetical protein